MTTKELRRKIDEWEQNARYYRAQYMRSLDRNDWLKYLQCLKNIRNLKIDLFQKIATM